MKVIGITGGVGAGKSEVLKFLKEHCNCKIVFADEIGNDVKLPGNACFLPLIELLGDDVLEDGFISREKMAEKIFADRKLLEQVNKLIHPAVKEYIISDLEQCRKEGKIAFYFIEAALLLEDGYDAICDEFWYIDTREEIRRQRLKESRHYSDEKISQVIANQMSEEAFRRECNTIIDNSGCIEDTYRQILKKLEVL